MRETTPYFKCTYSRTFKINKNHKDKIPRQKKKNDIKKLTEKPLTSPSFFH